MIFRIIQPSDGYRPSYVFDWTILGVGLVAIPTGILRAGFVEQFSRSSKATTPPRRCPHCGKELPRD